MAFKEYPKMIYPNGKGIIVNNKEEEAKHSVKEEVKEEKKEKKSWSN